MLRMILIDLRGTLHTDYEAIPGVVEALKKLRSTNLMIKFVTNTSSEDKKIVCNRLTAIGINMRPEEIYSPLTATRNYVLDKKLKPMFLLNPEAMEEFEDIKLEASEKPNAVVIGHAPSQFYYDNLDKAFKLLKDGVPLIAISKSKYYGRKDGFALGSGCFVKGLEYSAQCEALIVGKPNPVYFQSALGDVTPDEAIMIGDDVADDIEGAMNAGLRGYLVQTGKYQAGDELLVKIHPTGVFPTFVEAVDNIVTEVNNGKL